jgi:serine protease Do
MKLELEKSGLTPDSVPVMQLGDAEHLRKGQFAIALGNPYAQARDGSASASLGIISNISRRPMPPADDRGIASDDATIHHYGTLVHVDTRLDLGTSGGALVNLDGELIGMTTALAALQGYEKSVGYAIPLDRGMRRIIDDLIRGYEAEYGFLGIQPGTIYRNDVRLGGEKLTQASAAVATQVAVDSPAWQSGLRNGDVILAIDDRPIYDDADLMRVVGLRGPDATVDLQVRSSSGGVTTLTVRLGKWPVYDDSKIVSTARRYPLWCGMAVDFPTARRRFLSSDLLETYRRAVVVTEVAAESPAAHAGLRVGDFVQKVNGVAVQTPAEFHAALAGAAGPVMLIMTDGQRRAVHP